MLVVKTEGAPLTVKVCRCAAKLHLVSSDPSTCLVVLVGQEGWLELGRGVDVRDLSHVNLQAVFLASTAALLYLLE